ncbi:uncharacterized protein LOC131074650 isoform X2 [Cryptomeria japonica]|uniref:uncharacterized protein LOC131074650 isoform X2 n=1 Tax=Cryptomeria japonica TaxID=3369 RepID=UPI0027DA3429|nr:uncharacterized protein LOC131074650 isoform X2 [Cryptomeria japonica]
MGSSQLGNASINLTDYIGAITPASISLPLKSCINGTILHVTIQQLTAKPGHRDSYKRMQHHIMTAEYADEDDLDDTTIFSDVTANGHGSEEKSGTSSKPHLNFDSCKFVSRRSEANGSRRYPHVDAISISSSGSTNTAKQEVPDIHEIGWKENGFHQDAVSFLSSLSQNAKVQKLGNNTGQWLAHSGPPEIKNGHGQNPNHSIENDNAKISKENERLKKSLQDSESTIEEHQHEILSLGVQTEELAMEMETLKKQLAKEVKQGQEFALEISSLKIERDSIKSEFEQLKALGVGSEKQNIVDKTSNEIVDARCTIEELRQELGYEKQININLGLQLQKTQESNSELLLAVQDLEELLEKKNKEIEDISNKTCDITIYGQNNQARTYQDIEMEWLQKLSSSEQKIREITDKIILNGHNISFDSLQDDMKILKTAFQEAKLGSNMIYKLNNEIDIINKRNNDHNIQCSSRKGSPLKNNESNLEAKEHCVRKSHFYSHENERLQYNQSSMQRTESDLDHLHDKILQLDKICIELKNRNQDLEEEIRISRLNIADLEFQLSMVDEEAQALTESNQHLEAKIETLEAENLELQSCLLATQEAGKLARAQIGDLMEEMSIISGKTESESGIRKSTDRQISEVEEEHGSIGNALLHLQKQNGQLLSRIFELENQQDESQQNEKQKDEDFKKMERKLSLELEKKVLELSSEAHDYKMARDCLAKQMEQIVHDYEALKQEHAECGPSEKQLQKELQNLRDEQADSLSKINILENKVKSLQQEIDIHATKCTAEFDAMLQLKNEQEQRAKIAEETLRKTRWNNATAAEQIQEEFKMLSEQLTATFDANEKFSTQALAEASELRLQKKNLQETLKKAEEDIMSIREQCRENIQEVTTQLDLFKQECETLSSKLQETSIELEEHKKNEANYITQTEQFSLKLATLQTEVEALRDENSELTQKVQECDCLKVDLEDAEIDLDGCRAAKTELENILERTNQEKIKLDEEIRSLQENLRNSEIEMNELKHNRDDQEVKFETLSSKLKEQAAQISSNNKNAHQLAQLRRQYVDLEQRFAKKESETEETRKQIFYLQEELQQKADALAIVERKYKDKEDKLKFYAVGIPVKTVSKVNNKGGPLTRNVKEISDLMNKVKLLENEVMSKTLALEASRQEYNAKEKSLQIKIEQLEMISQHLKPNHASFMDQLQDQLKSLKIQNLALLQREKELLCRLGSQENLQKEVQHLQTVNAQLESIISKYKEPLNSEKAEERILALEKELADALDLNKTCRKQLQSGLRKQEEQEAALKRHSDMNNAVDDIEALKRKNSTMEDELKEMHDRYSQISLKFAEVEGERQKLVMAIRSLKNAKRV